MENIRVRDKHPGSATLGKILALRRKQKQNILTVTAVVAAAWCPLLVHHLLFVALRGLVKFHNQENVTYTQNTKYLSVLFFTKYF